MLARVYEVKSWRRVSPLLAFGMLLLGLFVLLSSSGLLTPNRTIAKAQLPQQTSMLNQQLKPLGSLLNEDGTVNLKTGFSGSLDSKGWEMVSRPGEQPRFMRAGSKQTVASPSSMKAP